MDVEVKGYDVGGSNYSFRRHFNKKHYPLLGEEDEGRTLLINTRSQRMLAGPALSIPVPFAIDWLRNEKGRWHYPINGADEVFPGIFLGDASTALCIRVLKEMGVTAVLNCAQGELTEYNFVNTTSNYYQVAKMDFLGIPALDKPSYNLSQHFEETTQFLQTVLSKGGKVLVHCGQGISRSSSVVLAYLIIKKGLQLKVCLVVSTAVIVEQCGVLGSLFSRCCCEYNAVDKNMMASLGCGIHLVNSTAVIVEQCGVLGSLFSRYCEYNAVDKNMMASLVRSRGILYSRYCRAMRCAW